MSDGASALAEIERCRVEDPERAARRCEEYLQTHNKDVAGYLVLARCYVDLRQETTAIEVLRNALQLAPDRVNVLVFLGNLYLYLQQVAEAGRVFERGMQIAPDSAAVQLGFGRVLVIRGEITSAQECFSTALAIDPTLPGVSLHLARSRRFSSNDKEIISSLEGLRSHPGMSASALSDLRFALGKVSDDCGEYVRAFEHYEAANRLVAATVNFDRAAFTRSVDLLMLSFSPTYFNVRGHSGQSADTPIFVVGMPRSGTTLVEQILASHPVVHGAGELGYIDQLTRDIGAPVPYPRAVIGMEAELAFEFSQRYLRWTKALSQEALRIVDKMPSNFFHLGFIATLFPRAHIIHCQREPLDVCLSIYFQQFETGNEWAYDLSDIAYFHRGYVRLMDHWENVLPISIYNIHYEDLVAEPETSVRQLIEFCGLPWDSACLNFHQHTRAVLTGSNWQVRQPLYSQSVGRWKLYDPHLGPLKKELYSA